MTKSTITREQRINEVKELIANAEEWAGYYEHPIHDKPQREMFEGMARVMAEHLAALTAMDSEPVAYIFKHPAGRLFWSLTDESNKGHDEVMPVYASPQPAPIVEREPIAWLNDAYLARGVVDGEAGSEDAGPGYIPVYREAGPQPAPVVPEEWTIADAVKFCKETGRQDAGAAMDAWNACRAAMLQELQKSAGAEAICRSDENVQVLHTKSPAQSDCCPAQNVAVPAQSPIDHGYLPECECSGCKATSRICTEMAVNSLVISNEMTSEQAYEIGYYYGDPVNVFARGANWMRQHIIDSTLAAAQHDTPALNSVQSVVTVPGKWIPVSERMPEDRAQVILWDAEIGEVTSGHYSHKTQTFYHCGDAIENEITHWMPLPAAPQEVK
ncbi:DUF551 domain-containing protein [Klebsiella pneumoniae]|uniref:DUF551 domain-containing protein n=1 Tax=Klebsiella pneumoniae TaxID=573 RepID=UPI0020CC26A2|nr:DUF551 domain-containing protein [Klebsiella pneumoniae]MDZ6290142.1 DUF551 domain-containing protein [Klebsiella pneumoniae]